MRRYVRSLALALFFASRAAHADPPKPDGAAAGDVGPTVPPPPDGMGNRQMLRGDDLATKKEGHYFTGLPLLNFDPNVGFGFGARVYFYEDGTRKDPRFAYTPYEQRIFAQAFATTGGLQYHWLDYDAPNFLGSLYRIRASFEYAQNVQQNYFGVGARSLAALSFPGSTKTFAHASDYTNALAQVQPDGTTYGDYNKLFVRRPTLPLGVERLVFGGVMRPFLGVGFAYTTLRDYTGKSIDAKNAAGADVKAPEAPTLIALDCAAKRIVGCDGGWDNVIRVGVSVDTRDFEPDPNDGIYAELSGEFGTRALGSQYDYARVMLSVRGFYSPIPKYADLVLAGRVLYEVQSSGTPFTSMDNLPFIDDNHTGLGGFRTLRGYRDDRFVGPIIGLTNYEIRWTFVNARALHQSFAFMVVPFLDLGRVWDNVKTTSLAGWKRTEGAGLRIAWNEATIIMFDYGVSTEDSGFYVNFNHIF